MIVERKGKKKRIKVYKVSTTMAVCSCKKE